MKEILDDNSRHELIIYRLQRAAETLKEARYNADGEYYNAAVNRLYYACYYAASALMLDAGLETATHNGIRTMLGLKFVKPGILEARYGRIYQQLFENRQAGDYEDFTYCDSELFEELEPQAVDFVTRLTEMLSSK